MIIENSEVLKMEVVLKQPDDFRKIVETLTRIGIANSEEKKLYQSCHILHKQGRYFIVHFKELFLLDGRDETILTEEDITRRNTIAMLLSDWGLLETVNPIDRNGCSLSNICIIPHREKESWELIPKYTIGKYSKKSY